MSGLYKKLGDVPKRTSFTYLRELDPIFRNHDVLQLYRRYLFQGTRPSLAYHIDFFEEMTELDEGVELLGDGENERKVEEIYNKYFHASGESLLEVRKEIIEKIRDEMDKGKTPSFEPAVKVIIRDLAFVHFNGFWDCEEMREYKDATLNGEVNNSKKKIEKVRLEKFFGEEIDDNEAKRLNYRAQPCHVKQYRMDRIFGEKAIIDYEGKQTEDTIEEEGNVTPRRRAMTTMEWRRSRRLHVFFGATFPVADVMYSEKVRPTSSIGDFTQIRKQPQHVHPHRLNRFFGERVNETFETDTNASNTGTWHPSRHPKKQIIQRFFGERIDPTKEASSVSFANQPSHVKGHRLRKFFGTPPVLDEDTFEEPVEEVQSEERQSPPLETRRAHKLHKFFGKKIDEGEAVNN